MASNWIKLECITPDKPEVFAIARRLGVGQAEAFLAVFRVWCWFDANTLHGNAANVTELDMDTIARCAGITSAMISAGWMMVTADGLAIPNFDHHMGESAKKRIQTMNRVRNWRSRNAEVTLETLQSNDASVTKTLRETETETDITTPLPPKGGGEGGDDEKTDRGQRRRELREALKRIFGLPDGTREQGKRLGHLVREYEAVQATGEEIAVRRKRVIAAWGEEKATAKAVVRHWGQFDHDLEPLPFGNGRRQTPSKFGYPGLPSKAESEAYLRECREHEAKVVAERAARNAALV